MAHMAALRSISMRQVALVARPRNPAIAPASLRFIRIRSSSNPAPAVPEAAPVKESKPVTETPLPESSSFSGQNTAQPEPEILSKDQAADKSKPAFDGMPSAADMLDALEGAKAEGVKDESAKENASEEEPRGPKKDYVSSLDRKREQRAQFAMYGFLGALIGAGIYMGRPFDDVVEAQRHKDVPNDYNPLSFWERLKARWTTQTEYYTKPAFEKLLPEPLPAPYQRPYTLLLDLDDLLIHSEWTRETGWRIAKRPGLDYFLGYLSQYYELVIFTSQPAGIAMPVVDKLDPYKSYISAALFRDAALYKDGKYIKDLTYLNRSLDKVITIDHNPDAWTNQPENAIKLKPWKGDSSDRELVGLIPFLEYVAIMGFDTREVLKQFEGKHVPTEYMERENAARQKMIANWEAERAAKGGKGKAGFMGGLLGGSKSSRKDQPPKFFMDEARERGLQGYLEFKQYLEKNGDAMIAEQKAAEQKQMQDMTMSLQKLLFEGAPKPGQPQEQQ
ncbi:mitochondrial inner membrane protein required for protein import [Saitoella coloradoensis]